MGRASITQRGRPGPRWAQAWRQKRTGWCGWSSRAECGAWGGAGQPPTPHPGTQRTPLPRTRLPPSLPSAPHPCLPARPRSWALWPPWGALRRSQRPRPTSGSSVLCRVRGRVLCCFSLGCVSLWWAPCLQASAQLFRLPHTLPPSFPRQTPARPWPLLLLWEVPWDPKKSQPPSFVSPRGCHPLTGPAQQALSPAAESCGDGPLCLQDSPAHCPT